MWLISFSYKFFFGVTDIFDLFDFSSNFLLRKGNLLKILKKNVQNYVVNLTHRLEQPVSERIFPIRRHPNIPSSPIPNPPTLFNRCRSTRYFI